MSNFECAGTSKNREAVRGASSTKLKRAIQATVLFVVFLFAIYYVHVAVFEVNVVFYAAISDGVLAAFLTGAVIFLLRYFDALNKFEKSQLVAIWLLAGYGFAISVPTVIDRSLSFYILEKLQQRGGGIKLDSFEDVFTKEYVKEDQLVAVRLTEQQQSGTIVIENGCVKLTKKGDELATFSQMFRHHLLPKKRLLMGTYSDVLTDPFRNSPNIESYRCK
ncbi:hypothetical protein [Paraburkholderia sp. CNPSo 3281]|uniref:hypothetical protein n=1 Tax=Paraburkholderia sp. CNPSo 3281 TaxID=2940933 RepID=UPI0020B75B7B|nr:hypothetical protein [Paraburkholderia sp. CNPSo 3281]MCP3720354.1 hypothetical protein [Paraburkholderia sp. CNPSo 3281]